MQRSSGLSPGLAQKKNAGYGAGALRDSAAVVFERRESTLRELAVSRSPEPLASDSPPAIAALVRDVNAPRCEAGAGSTPSTSLDDAVPGRWWGFRSYSHGADVGHLSLATAFALVTYGWVRSVNP